MSEFEFRDDLSPIPTLEDPMFRPWLEMNLKQLIKNQQEILQGSERTLGDLDGTVTSLISDVTALDASLWAEISELIGDVTGISGATTVACKAYLSAGDMDSVGSNSTGATLILLDGANPDTNSCFSAANSRYVFDTSGTYWVYGQVMFYDASPGQIMRLMLVTNTTAPIGGFAISDAQSDYSGTFTVSVGSLLEASVGMPLYLYAVATAASDVTTTNVDANADRTFMCLNKV